jgi:GNAT superfamily N-acetyltransferase
MRSNPFLVPAAAETFGDGLVDVVTTMARSEPRPRRTLRHVWRRGRAIVRAQGWTGLLFTVLADLGYRRFLLLERRLDAPIAAVAPRLSLVFGRLQPADLEEYLAVHAETPRAAVAERFARGDECFVARHDGGLVGISWVSRDAHFFRSLGCRWTVAEGERYFYDAFTAPAHRGRGVGPALGVHVLEELRRAGTRRVVLAIAPENAPSRRARAKNGFRPFGRIHYLRLGGRRWHRHVAVDGEGTAAAC